MAIKRLKKSAAAPKSGEQLAQQVMDSAQRIWLAGLGAFAKAQEEGGKVFDTLVKQGQEIEKKTRAVAEKAVEAAKSQAADTVGKATGTLDKLDQVFQDRVHRSLNKLGVLTSKDIDELTKQVTELSESVRGLVAQEKRAAGSKPAAKKSAAPKATKNPTAKTGPKPAAAKPAVKKPVVKSTVATMTAAARKTAKSGMKQAAQVVKNVTDKLV